MYAEQHGELAENWLGKAKESFARGEYESSLAASAIAQVHATYANAPQVER